jgi:hypothetical protein
VKQFGPDTQGRFQLGDFVHNYIQEQVLPGHMTMHENQVRVEVDGLTLKGHYDCFDGNTVYDFKSRSGWYRFDPPYNYHIDQLHVYMKALGVQQGLMVYISKKDFSVETYPDYFGQSSERDQVAEQGKLVEFQESRWEQIVEKARKVHDVLETNGFPTSIEEVDQHFPNCGDCMGCKFEDGNEFDFSHVEQYSSHSERGEK